MVNALMFFERLHIIELRRAQPGTGMGSGSALAPQGAQAPPGPARATGPVVTTRVADEATLQALQQEGGWGIDDHKWAFLRGGDTCLLSLVDGRIAGYTWVHTRGCPEILPGLQLQLPAHALYNFAGFTHPDFRGAGLQARRHEAVLSQACWADRPTMLGYVKATNFSSQHGQGRSGYRKIGSVLLLGSRRRFLTWMSPALRRMGVQRLDAPAGWGRRGLNLLARLGQRAWVGAVSHTVGPWLHRRLLRQADRSSHHTYTCFHRAPAQLAALSGPVLAHLGMQANPADRRRRALRVLLYACSNGAEAYTLSAWLAMERPDLEVIIEASDLHADMVDQARAGRYTWDEVVQHHTVPARFIAQAFDRDGEHYVVNERTRSRVRFSCANIVRDDLRARFGEADIVLAQNVLFHLPPPMARRAFSNVARTLAPNGALFIEGMDLDLRVSLTQAHDLQPLAWRNREIYDESRRHIPARWWQVYYGAEPWLPLRHDPQRRYGSIFLKGPGRERPLALAQAAQSASAAPAALAA